MFDNTSKSYLYPDNWRVIAYEIKSICGWQCQCCGLQCRRPGELWLGWEYELTVAHICQNYEAEAVCVAALCIRCHFKMDAPLAWVARRRVERVRRRLAGQLVLALKIP